MNFTRALSRLLISCMILARNQSPACSFNLTSVTGANSSMTVAMLLLKFVQATFTSNQLIFCNLSIFFAIIIHGSYLWDLMYDKITLIFLIQNIMWWSLKSNWENIWLSHIVFNRSNEQVNSSFWFTCNSCGFFSKLVHAEYS